MKDCCPYSYIFFFVCLSGRYVATLECKKSRLGDTISVKVYLNWSIAHRQPQYRTRVRVAGLGYRSSNVQTGSHLEVHVL